jgi:hypothetical protein
MKSKGGDPPGIAYNTYEKGSTNLIILWNSGRRNDERRMLNCLIYLKTGRTSFLISLQRRCQFGMMTSLLLTS